MHSGFRLVGTTSVLLALLVGCQANGTGTEPGPTPAIAIALGSSSTTIPQGGFASVTATLTRSGGFTGTVTLSVEGAPGGVTADVGSAVVGGVTSATITIHVTTSALPGTYPLTAKAEGSGVATVTAPFSLTITAVDYALSATPAAVSIVQGGSRNDITVGIVRTNMPDAVTLSLGGAVPTGVTGAFSPVAPTGTSATLTLSVPLATATGSYNLTVNGSSTPGARSTPLVLTVTLAGSFTLSVTPTGTIPVQQNGNNNTRTVNITRTAFTGNVTLAAEGLPTGLTASFAPNNTATNSSVVTFAATTAVAPNTYTGTVRGTAVGAADATTPVSITVTAAPTPVSVTMDFSNCFASSGPVWFATSEDGIAWTQRLPANNVYQFTFSAGRGAVAYSFDDSGFQSTTVVMQGAASWATWPSRGCSAVSADNGPTGRISVPMGTTTGVLAGQWGNVSIGYVSMQFIQPGTNPLTGFFPPPGTFDAHGVRQSRTAPFTADRGFLRRDIVIVATGNTLGTIDFTGSESFVPFPISVTVTDPIAGESFSHEMDYLTGSGANACTFGVFVPQRGGSAAAFTTWGIPAVLQRGNDYHRYRVTAVTNSGLREVAETFHTAPATRNVTLGSLLAVPTITTLSGGGYRRLQASVSLLPEHRPYLTLYYSSNSSTGVLKSADISVADDWIGNTNAVIAMPNFTGVAGWSDSWAPSTALGGSWTLSGGSTTPRVPCTEGFRAVRASQSGSY